MEFGVPKHLVWLVRNLTTKSTGVVRVGEEQSDEFPLTPHLCLFYKEDVE